MLKAKVIVKGNCIICGKPIDNDNVFFCKVCERGNYMSELDNPISEKKMQIVINNYFKTECSVNTSIREAFEKGFRIGVSKSAEKTGEWVKVHGYATPGGDPVWACPKCGKGIHVYGIEHGTYGKDIADHQWVACPNCGAKLK
jgi:rubrerythrin